MQAARDLLHGPWRGVGVLSVTQILAWGSIYYTPVLILPRIAAERGWSLGFAMGGLSLGLLIAGLVAPKVGTLIDRFGGHVIMTAGSLIGGAGLLALGIVDHHLGYLAAWVVLGAALAASLYDAAFASLGRIFGSQARKPITVLTLAGGFASTVSWPVTGLLIAGLGWRTTYFVYAALLALVAAPLHAFCLPRTRFDTGAGIAPQAGIAPARSPPHRHALLLVAGAFTAYAFIPSGLAAHLLAIFARAGVDAAAVIIIGALFGPSQVIARLIEFVFARNVAPLTVALCALATVIAGFALIGAFGVSTAVAACFIVMFGMANGLMTIARGTLPLALFGPAGYGRLVGRLAAPALVMQSVAPVILAVVAERSSDSVVLALTAALAATAL
ncbi:MAG: MFS transporter, partial [Proteobacteria bacterium]|nr:MFS transporter [Pseudomonadota bacterium]